MAATGDAKALEWIAAAEKAMKKSFFKSADPVAASEAYDKAANLYKLSKQWDKAGDVLVKSAECLSMDKQSFSAARKYQDAALAYSKGTSGNAIGAWKSAIALYVEEGKMSQAGKAMRDLADLELAAGDAAGAFDSITNAIEYLEMANEPIAASQLKQKAAELAVETNQFATAAEHFEAVAKNATLSFAQVDPYFRAALCHLVGGDTVATSKCLDRYGGESIEFTKSAEFIFLDEMIKAIETADKAAFEEACKTYQDKGRNRLDAWKTNILKKIKATIPNEEDELL